MNFIRLLFRLFKRKTYLNISFQRIRFVAKEFVKSNSHGNLTIIGKNFQLVILNNPIGKNSMKIRCKSNITELENFFKEYDVECKSSKSEIQVLYYNRIPEGKHGNVITIPEFLDRIVSSISGEEKEFSFQLTMTDSFSKNKILKAAQCA